MNPSHVLSANMQTGKGLGTFNKPKLCFTVMDCGGGGGVKIIIRGVKDSSSSVMKQSI